MRSNQRRATHGLRACAPFLAFALATACQTLAPQQTASTVDPGTWRVGVQISASPWCSTILEVPSPGTCDQFPRGSMPIPELRVSGRTGLFPRVDVGLSLHGTGVVLRGNRIGGLADAKFELWSAPAAAGRHLVSAAVGVGAAREQSFVESADGTVIPDLDVLVPVFYGYQAQHWELVASGRFLERFTFLDVTGDGRATALEQTWLGLAVGAYTRGWTRFGISLEYSAPSRGLHRGSFTASFGVLFDIGGRAALERSND